MYDQRMEVPVSMLRTNLAEWIGRARRGDDVVITDRGTPVARLVPVDSAPLLEQLMQEGVLARAQQPNRRRAEGAPRVRARGSVSDLVVEQRR